MNTARAALALASACALAACGGIIPAGNAPASYQAGPDQFQIGTGRDYPRAARGPQKANTGSSNGSSQSTRQSLRVASTPMGAYSAGAGRSCLTQLSATGARFNRIPDQYGAPGCNQLGTVKLASMSGDISDFSVSNIGPVKCETAKTFTDWARYGVDRAARQILKSPLAQIETMGSYSCRNIAGTTRRSSHATGNAIDVSGFVLADGRRISLKADWKGGTAAEREFLRVVHKSGCKRFGTVLGPDYNAAHRDHFHLEGSSSAFCR